MVINMGSQVFHISKHTQVDMKIIAINSEFVDTGYVTAIDKEKKKKDAKIIFWGYSF